MSNRHTDFRIHGIDPEDLTNGEAITLKRWIAGLLMNHVDHHRIAHERGIDPDDLDLQVELVGEHEQPDEDYDPEEQ